MPNSETILELLEDIAPRGYCDDCLSAELQILPRQQVNHLARQMETRKQIVREKGVCQKCNKGKITNTWKSEVHEPRMVKEPEPNYQVSIQEKPINIEECRTRIVKMGRTLWKRDKTEDPARSISAVILALRDEKKIPSHQANMMLTICNLRNVAVYEDLELGAPEIEIAKNAMAIVEMWWKKESS